MSKTISGSNIRIDDALRAPLIDFEIEGKTTQETSTQSANLCPPFTDSRWTFTNGASVTSDGYLSIPATTGAKATIIIPWNKSRTCYFKDIIVSGGNAHYAGEYFNASGTQVSSNGKAVYDKGANFQDETMWGGDNQYGDALTQTTSIKFTIQFSNYTPNAYVIKNLIISENNINYIPFAPNMPSPDYPSELVSVGYENIINYRNFLNLTTGTTTTFDDEGITITSSGSFAYAIYQNINLQPNTTYTITTESEWNIPKNGSQWGFRYRDSNNTYSNMYQDKMTFTTDNIGNYQILYYLGTPNNNVGTVYIKNIILTKGTQEHSYIPYGKYGIEIKTTGKNLLDFDNFLTSSNSTYTQQNGIFTITAVGNAYNTPQTLNLKPSTTYTLSQTYQTQNSTNVRIEILEDSTVIVTCYATNQSHTVKTFTTNSSSTYKIRLNYSTFSTSMIINKPMLEENNQATTFEEYKGKTFLYTLNQPLRSVGNVKDLLYIKQGKLYIDRWIGTITLNGTESYSNQSGTYDTATRMMFSYNPSSIPKDMTSRKGMCNYFKNYSSTVQNVNVDVTAFNFNNSPQYSNFLYFKIEKDLLPTQDASGFASWVANHNLFIQYQMASATTEELGDIDIPIVYKGVTYINTTDAIEPTMNVTYSNDISAADKTALRNNTAAIKCKLTVLADGNLPAIELTENNSVKDWEYTDERLVPGQGFIGQFVGRTLDGNLQNISDTFNITDRTINLNIGIYRINDDVTTWYDYGNFIVTEPEDNEVNDNTKFESMDYTKLFNKTFDGNYIDDNFTTSYNDLMGVNLSEEDKKTFVVTPVTARWVALYTCAQVGVPLATTSFTNSDFEIDINPFQAGESCRDVMKAIGKLALSWVRVGWDNRCYIDFGIENTVDTYDILDKDQYFTLETVEDITPVDGVGFGMQGVDGETAFKIKNNQSVEDAENIIYVYDNPFLYTFEKRTQAVQQASVLFGLTYTQLKTETIGHPWLTGTELINVKNMENLPNYTYAFNKTIKYTGHIRSIINSIDETEVEKTLGYTSSTLKASRNATINVNKQEGTLQMLTSRVEDVEEDINNVYTKQEINELIEDATGLTNIYKTSGGANKFRNTGLWYRENNGFEYWTGSVSAVSEANSASGTAMMLQQSTLTQTLSNIPNGKYTVSFKFEKTNPTANLQVLINSVDYAEQLVNGKFEQTVSVSTNSIELSLICSVANGYKIYELMCNVGEAALVWTQHPDEVRTDTVNISKGITITSSVNNSEIYFKADYDGIRVVNQSDNKTTEFTDDGMITDNATIKKQAKISGALHTIVGSQTWISGIQ